MGTMQNLGLYETNLTGREFVKYHKNEINSNNNANSSLGLATCAVAEKALWILS
jgi:hypothetical protein